ncbi:MAG: putative O-glycosylation ligase, exosortase A system-associated [Alphaproteobacteria bacterium]|nr:putative O-glycosylation ligase, exosortase A system-associated [Alphaproteobacteria bacterium]
MRDLFFVGFMLFMFYLGFRRAYMGALCYIWIDLLQPQEQSYYLINTVPISMISALFAVLVYVIADRDKDVRVTNVQVLIGLLIAWMFVTTARAELPEVAWAKWDPAWKALGFALFLPLVIRTRLQIEAALMVIVFTVLAIMSSGALKTALGGGGYGSLSFLVDRNVGLFESSTIATVSVGMIPIAIYLYKYNSLFPPSLITRGILFFIIACAILTVIGTEARTGLVCLAIVAFTEWLRSKRKMLWVGAAAIAALSAVPFLPSTFTSRMGTIKTYNEDQSASTRLAMWEWTLNYVASNPLGGGFGIWRTSKIEVDLKRESESGNVQSESVQKVTDEARGFHSSYFEMLGEHGFIGFGLFLAIFLVTLVKLLRLRARFKDGTDDAWLGECARALAVFTLVYMAGSAFQALAIQSTVYYMMALASSLSLYVVRRDDAEKKAAVQPPLMAARRTGVRAA